MGEKATKVTINAHWLRKAILLPIEGKSGSTGRQLVPSRRNELPKPIGGCARHPCGGGLGDDLTSKNTRVTYVGCAGEALLAAGCSHSARHLQSRVKLTGFRIPGTLHAQELEESAPCVGTGLRNTPFITPALFNAAQMRMRAAVHSLDLTSMRKHAQ